MTRRLFTPVAIASIAAAIFLAAPAYAAEDKKKPEGPPTLDLALVGLPIVWEGKLVNYVFVAIHLNVKPGVDVSKLREKEPYYRDALVRAAHRRPFVKPWDFTHIDRGALTEVMMQESARIAGPGVITGVQIVSETPQKQSGLPQRPKP